MYEHDVCSNIYSYNMIDTTTKTYTYDFYSDIL